MPVMPAYFQALTRLEPQALRGLLFFLFTLNIVVFPLGQAFRVAGPLVCLVVLGLVYWRDFAACTLPRLPVRYLFVLFFACVALQTVFSIDTRNSFSVISPNLLRAFVLPFIAMECVRTEKNLKMLLIAFAFTVLYEGLDGIWQYIYGFDLIRNAPVDVNKAINLSRLTGSLGGYRVGDYMGIMLVPALGLALLLPLRTAPLRWSAAVLLLAPAFFLLIFAQARSGYLGFLVGLYAVLVLAYGRLSFVNFFLPLAIVCLLILFGPQRVSLETALQDQRFQIWALAWKTFLASPLMGTGASSFVPAFLSTGLTIEGIAYQGTEIMHPHNAYLQFLIDGGIVGFLGIMSFLFGCTVWAFSRIYKGIRLERTGLLHGVHWQMSAYFWGGWIAYLVVLLAGHDFYRTWFLATGMTILGIVLGACVSGPRLDEA